MFFSSESFDEYPFGPRGMAELMNGIRQRPNIPMMQQQPRIIEIQIQKEIQQRPQLPPSSLGEEKIIQVPIHKMRTPQPSIVEEVSTVLIELDKV